MWLLLHITNASSLAMIQCIMHGSHLVPELKKQTENLMKAQTTEWERWKRCVDIPSMSRLLWGLISSPITSCLLLPLEICCQTGCTLSSVSTHTSGMLKMHFVCLSKPPGIRFPSAASCAVSTMHKMFGAQHISWSLSSSAILAGLKCTLHYD